MKFGQCWRLVDGLPVSGYAWGRKTYPQISPLLYPQSVNTIVRMTRLHLHLLSDSTGETLENIAKAAIAQFENVEAIRHFWP